MVATTGLVIIGFFTWWAIRECKISREKLQELVTAAGFTFKVPEAKLRSAFLKAVREIKSRSKQENLLIRKIKKNAEEYLFGLVDESVDVKAEHLNYSHTATLKFSPTTGQLSCDFEAHRAFQLIKAKFEEFSNTLDSDDVRTVLLQLLGQLFSIGVRERGGIYFVPAKFEAQVDALEKLVEQLPGNCFLAVAPQIDIERSKKAIYKSFMENLKEKLSTFENDLENLTQNAALRTRLADFKEIRKEIEFYRDALAFQSEDLTVRLDNLTTKVTEKLTA